MEGKKAPFRARAIGDTTEELDSNLVSTPGPGNVTPMGGPKRSPGAVSADLIGPRVQRRGAMQDSPAEQTKPLVTGRRVEGPRQRKKLSREKKDLPKSPHHGRFGTVGPPPGARWFRVGPFPKAYGPGSNAVRAPYPGADIERTFSTRTEGDGVPYRLQNAQLGERIITK